MTKIIISLDDKDFDAATIIKLTGFIMNEKPGKNFRVKFSGQSTYLISEDIPEKQPEINMEN